MAERDDLPEDGLKPWQQLALVTLVAVLLLLSFVADRRPFDNTRPDVLDSLSAVLDITLGVVALFALINIRKIVEWLFDRLAIALARRGLILVTRPRPGARADRDASNESEIKRPDEEIPHEDVQNEEPISIEGQEVGEAFEQAQAIRDREGRVRIARRVDGCLAWIAAGVILACIPVAFVQLNKQAEQRQQVEEAATPPAHECPTYCRFDAGALSCQLQPGEDPTTLARAILGATASDGDVARLANSIWQRNRDNVDAPNDRRIPPGTVLSVTQPPGACTVGTP